MQVKSLMSNNVVTVEMDDPLSTVKEIFDKGKLKLDGIVLGDPAGGFKGKRKLLCQLS